MFPRCMSSASQGRRRGFFGVLCGSLLSACSGTKLPAAGPLSAQAENGSGAADSPNVKPAATPAQLGQLSPSASVQSTASPDQTTIVAFKGKSVILYNADDGNDGQRMPVTAFSLPIIARKSTGGSRLEVATSEGPRWIAPSEVVVATTSPSATTPSATTPSPR